MSANDELSPVNDTDVNSGGVSNTTIAVLTILALLITVIGTWAVLSGMNSTDKASIVSSGTNVGKVSFTVISLETPVNQDTGMIVLDVK
jgi:hypothetical protein